MAIRADEVVFSKRKRLAISVLPGGKVVVRAPLRTSRAVIERFVDANQGWIKKAQTKMARLALPVEVAMREGEMLWYLGKRYPLYLAPKVKGGLAFEPDKYFLLQADQQSRGKQLLKAFYRSETRRLTSLIVAYYAARSGLKPSAVKINSAKTRWGSCSMKGGVNFSLRLTMMPISCVEYIVVHELAHLKQHNHSASFWELVGSMLPGYQKERQWLKQFGLSLPLFD